MKYPIDSVLISAGVSALVTIFALLLKQFFDHRTERLKLSHASRVKVEDSLLPRRLALYPKLIELIYRSRNIARDITLMSAAFAPSLLDELKIIGNEYEALLYKGRSDLERDHVFKGPHSYKLLMTDFCRCSMDVGYAKSHNNVELIKSNIVRLKTIYAEIDASHANVIKQLSSSDLLIASTNEN